MPKELYSPSIEDILDYGNPDSCVGVQPSNPDQEIVALATAVFQSIEPRVCDSHKALTARLGADYRENLWLIPAQERMPYPDACLYAVASMMQTERVTGRKADWFLWLEDDVVVPSDLFEKLRSAADPEKRPFVATVGYDRYPKFLPAVWDETKEGRLKRWVDQPSDGVVEVAATGLVAALFHRSLFDVVPQPWFGVTQRHLKNFHENVDSPADSPIAVGAGFKPDMFWSRKLHECGIPILVHCGVTTTHMGLSIPINSRTAPILRELSFMERDNLEAMTRGHTRGDNSVSEEITDDQRAECDPAPETRKSSPVYANLRQSVPASVGWAHGTGNELGEEVLT